MLLKHKLSFVVFFNASFFLLALTSKANPKEDIIITKTVIFNAEKERIWSALTNEKELSNWWNEGVILEPVVGGIFYEPWGDNNLATGIVLDLRDTEFIEFTWQEKQWKNSENTICRFLLTKVNNTTVLELKHVGWETFKEKEKQKKIVDGFSAGWDFYLNKLKKYIDQKTVKNSPLNMYGNVKKEKIAHVAI